VTGWDRARDALASADAFLETLPAKPDRDEDQQRAADEAHDAARRVRRRFLARHADDVYDELTDRHASPLDLAELVFAAAERFPALTPSRAQMAREDALPQAEKEGREIDQGIFFAAVLAAARAGGHLVSAMLRPTARATALLGRFRAEGSVVLPAARLDRRGPGGHITITNEHCLNAEDTPLVADLETLVDLVLLAPEVHVGVLRGGVMTHPRHAGRRVFSAGINLRHLRAGSISYVDFLLRRELGFLNKMVRGQAAPAGSWRDERVQKPWLAAVDSFAIGGGAQILLACDRVIAAGDAFASLPAADEGIVPGAANLRLTRLLGARPARRLILGGERVTADGPLAGLFFDEVVAPERVGAAVEEAVARLDSAAVTANRKMLNLAEEPIEQFRLYLAEFALEQALRAYSPDVRAKLDRRWAGQSSR
jgi:(3,5-dihydroxyphenyl)acetyl-CoA 1,2-dioxygenase